MSTAQIHPLEQRDWLIVDRLAAVTQPGDADLVDCARLLLRYQGFPGAEALKDQLQAALQQWGLEREQLFDATRQIWAGGYRPATGQEAEVGSGADVGAE